MFNLLFKIFLKEFKYALIFCNFAKHNSHIISKDQILNDEDIVKIITN